LAAVLLASAALAASPASAVTAAAGVPVSCVSDADWAVAFPPSVAHARGVYDSERKTIALRSILCDRLTLLTHGAEPSSVYYQYDFAEAVFLLGHEAAHARGIDDESEADCASGRGFLRTASALGATRRFALVLAGYLVNARLPRRCLPG
jgi:hypothetical protein